MSLYIYRRILKSFKRNNFDLIAIYVCDIVYYREIKKCTTWAFKCYNCYAEIANG